MVDNMKALRVKDLAYYKGKEDAFNAETYLGKTAQAASAAKLGNAEAVGSATKPVYFTDGGVPAAGTYELNKTVPADAVFTDTTYADVTADSTGAAASGLMTSSDKDKLDKVADGAQANVLEGVTIGGTDATVEGKKVALGSAAAATVESTLTNGSNLPTGAAVQGYVEGLGYQTASDVSGAISTALSTVMDYKGVKATKAELPSSGNKVGDVWHVTADTSEYAWNGDAWEELGLTFDASGYQTTIEWAENSDIDALFAAE